jgi:hypothetical protein
MTNRPILFSGPMVRALLAGTKTQTRRVLRMPDAPFDAVFNDNGVWSIGDALTGAREHKLPVLIAVGDWLYVRETWSGTHAFRNTPPAQRENCMTPDGPLLREDVWFWADGNPDGGDYEKPRPGIHMPRWASRLTLTVTEVRVQRLQEISEEDARAEGITPLANGRYHCGYDEEGQITAKSPVTAYGWLWNSINGEDAWSRNPWVAAYTFTVEQKNIDQAEAA